MSTLAEALARFDGTHVEDLRDALPEAEAAGKSLIAACTDPDTEVAASWLAKALIEVGTARFDPARFFETLPRMTHWQAQLHLLQSVQYAPDLAQPLARQIRDLLDSRKTFVRVWALDAFTRLAILRPELVPEARARIAAALDHGPASLRARARALEALL